MIHINHLDARDVRGSTWVLLRSEDGLVFSVELIPDAAIEAAVRSEWNRLIDAGLPSSGRNPSPSNRPHITLAVRDRLDANDVAAAAPVLPLSLELGGVLLFGRRGSFVLARQVVPTEALLALHRRVAEWLGPPQPRYANTGPDRWSPHVTLARRLDSAQLAHALRVIDPAAVTGQAVGLRVWDASARRITTLR